MTLRHLVPALGLAALTATSAFAADKGPEVSFSGWSDNILTFANDDTKDTPAAGATGTAKDESKASLRFSAAASLKAKWRVSDRVDTKVNLWFFPDTSTGGDSTATPSTYVSNANFQAREMYVTVDLTNGFSWQMGKYIDHVGWISAEPTGLFSVNNSLIGYLGIYGNDVIGTALNYSDADKSPFSGQIHITNGYFTASDALSPGYVASPNVNRENNDLGFGVDLNYALPNKMGDIDFDFAYDTHSGLNATNAPGVSGLGGSAYVLGLNATIKPVKELTIGAEIMLFTLADGENSNKVKQANTGYKRTQGLLLANYVIPSAPWNMSVTGLIQYIQIKTDAAVTAANSDKEKRMEVAAEVLTNPFGTKNFGLNGEIGYWKKDDVGFVKATDQKGISISIEAIATF